MLKYGKNDRRYSDKRKAASGAAPDRSYAHADHRRGNSERNEPGDYIRRGFTVYEIFLIQKARSPSV